MYSSLFNIAVFSAISCSTISQAAPIVANLDVAQSIHGVEQRAPYAPKTKLFLGAEVAVTGSTNTRTLPQNRDIEDDVSVFDITDDSGAEPEIKHIMVPKNFPSDATEDAGTESASSRSSASTTDGDVEEEEEDEQKQQQQQEVLGSIAACGIDTAGRNYCRTTDGWFEYRCETGEVMYYRHIPYADEEVCSDGSIA
ncbi:uncharacterized protein BKCO1_6300036 [Diplodia corticola]|uniref:Uncharacterized protein n=1 Tax=Diplodia corticola TaxID=236234 RepID=A0A1J9RRZ7_9PEZI|nr:uncharacterized protein BKCO1_6300036 [Diplodia corticola]OJD30301.1 hypothetical protein BKCO1_6300036 [Diplodia corticola]